MPGIGPRSAAQILKTVGDMSDFPTAETLSVLCRTIAPNKSVSPLDDVPLAQQSREQEFKQHPTAIVFCINQILS